MIEMLNQQSRGDQTGRVWLGIACFSLMLFAGCGDASDAGDVNTDSTMPPDTSSSQPGSTDSMTDSMNDMVDSDSATGTSSEDSASETADTVSSTDDSSTQTPDTSQIDAQNLLNRIFVAYNYERDGQTVDVVPDTRLSISFTAEVQEMHLVDTEVPELEMTATTGCNSLFVPFTIENGRLMSNGMASTLIGCNPELNVQESFVQSFMGSNPYITLDGDTVIFESDVDSQHIRIAYLDVEIASPDLPLTGTAWEAYSVNYAHAAWTSPAVLNFNSDGTMSFFSGCNQGSATYTLAGSEITFSAFSITEAGCADDDAQKHESAVIGIIGSASPAIWDVQEDYLHLTGASDYLVLLGSVD